MRKHRLLEEASDDEDDGGSGSDVNMLALNDLTTRVDLELLG